MWRIHESFRHQVISWTNAELLWLGPLETNVKYESKYNNSRKISWKWVSNCRLPNDSQFCFIAICICWVTLYETMYKTSIMINYTIFPVLFPCHEEKIWLFCTDHRLFPGTFCEDYNNKVRKPFVFYIKCHDIIPLHQVAFFPVFCFLTALLRMTYCGYE